MMVAGEDSEWSCELCLTQEKTGSGAGRETAIAVRIKIVLPGLE